MQPLHRPRGRPKGTGINDRARLRDIAMLIASQPHIKPTTAIKMLGEHDPSVIRRLRDKFFSLHDDLMQEIRASKVPILGSGPAAASSATALARGPGVASTHVARLEHDMAGTAPGAPMGLAAELAAALGRPSEGAGTAKASPTPVTAIGGANVSCLASMAVTPAPTTADPQTTTDLDRSKLVDLASYNVMLGLAIQATVAAIGQQTRVYEETLRLPPIVALLKQQIAIGEMVMAMTWPAGQARMEALQPAAAG